jgi:hypothetical protein
MLSTANCHRGGKLPSMFTWGNVLRAARGAHKSVVRL